MRFIRQKIGFSLNLAPALDSKQSQRIFVAQSDKWNLFVFFLTDCDHAWILEILSFGSSVQNWLDSAIDLTCRLVRELIEMKFTVLSKSVIEAEVINIKKINCRVKSGTLRGTSIASLVIESDDYWQRQLKR